jgi:hypothetical protein
MMSPHYISKRKRLKLHIFSCARKKRLPESSGPRGAEDVAFPGAIGRNVPQAFDESEPDRTLFGITEA